MHFFERILNKKASRKRSKSKKKLARKMPQWVNSVLGLLFVALGIIFLFAFPTLPKKTTEAKEPIRADESFSKSKKEAEVVRILIPSIDVDLSVKPAKIVGGYWETSETTASHGEGSANPGEKGNVVVFAHAREGLFYNLKDIKKGEIIYIFTKDKWFRYKVSETKTVYPTDTETVAPTNKEVLTLFTCSGFFDEKRLIVKALPQI